ncbi:hypothetical protein [Pseudoalteromonas galatheae]|uniref:hypothetical protein n=1 Tax=Pseudoalteromonas galatheae TaxID=579562 RepID=UPI0030D2D7D5
MKATVFMAPEFSAITAHNPHKSLSIRKILQPQMHVVEQDFGKLAVAIKLNDCDMGHWYFLTADPSGTIWGNGWDDAQTLSDCFTLFVGMDEAKAGLEHLKSLRKNRVSDSAIFKMVQVEPDLVEVKRV